MARKKLFGNHRSASCDVCEFGQLSSDSNAVLCARLGVVPRYHHCRRFRYDPLKRIPARQKPLQSFDAADFSLDELALDEPITNEVMDTPASLAAKQADLTIPEDVPPKTDCPAAEDPLSEQLPAEEPIADASPAAAEECPAAAADDSAEPAEKQADVTTPAKPDSPATEEPPAEELPVEEPIADAPPAATAYDPLLDPSLLDATGLSPETLAELRSCLEGQSSPSAQRILELLMTLTPATDAENTAPDTPDVSAEESLTSLPVSRNVAMAALHPEANIRLLDEDAEYEEDSRIDEAAALRLSGHPSELNQLVLLPDADEDEDPEQDLLAKDLIFMSEASLNNIDENKQLIMTDDGPAVKTD